jgi:hypothetical protein
LILFSFLLSCFLTSEGFLSLLNVSFLPPPESTLYQIWRCNMFVFSDVHGYLLASLYLTVGHWADNWELQGGFSEQWGHLAGQLPYVHHWCRVFVCPLSLGICPRDGSWSPWQEYRDLTCCIFGASLGRRLRNDWGINSN